MGTVRPYVRPSALVVINHRDGLQQWHFGKGSVVRGWYRIELAEAAVTNGGGLRRNEGIIQSARPRGDVAWTMRGKSRRFRGTPGDSSCSNSKQDYRQMQRDVN